MLLSGDLSQFHHLRCKISTDFFFLKRCIKIPEHQELRKGHGVFWSRCEWLSSSSDSGLGLTCPNEHIDRFLPFQLSVSLATFSHVPKVHEVYLSQDLGFPRNTNFSPVRVVFLTDFQDERSKFGFCGTKMDRRP